MRVKVLIDKRAVPHGHTLARVVLDVEGYLHLQAVVGVLWNGEDAYKGEQDIDTLLLNRAEAQLTYGPLTSADYQLVQDTLRTIKANLRKRRRGLSLGITRLAVYL